MKIKTGTKIILAQIATIILAAVTVYWVSFGGKFMWDDLGLIRDNPYITRPASLLTFITHDMGVGSNVQSNYYRPLQMITNKIDYMFWGLNPMGYHITNLVFHILAALALFYLIAILFDNKIVACMSALLFVVHPVHVEAVSYIAGRADSLAAFCMLLSLACYAKYLLRPRRRFYVFALGSFIFALLSKETSVIMPLLLLPIHIVCKKKITLLRWLPFFGILAAYLLFRQFVIHPILSPAVSLAAAIERIPGFLRSITRYLQILMFPLGLRLEYDSRLFPMNDFYAVIGMVASILLLWLARTKKNNVIVAFSILWFFIGLLPVSNLLHISYPYMMEHWCYFSSIGFFLVLAYVFSLLYKSKRFKSLSVLLAMAVLLFYSYLTIGQARQWRDPINVFQTALRYSPNNHMLYLLLGDEYFAAGNKEQAIGSYKKAVLLKRDFFEAYIRLGNIYYQSSQLNDAIEIYTLAIQIFPQSPKPYIGLANILTQSGREKEAIHFYRKAIENDSRQVQAYYNLGIVYKKIGEYQQAILMFQQALSADAHFLLAYYQLDSLYRNHHQTDKLFSLYEQAIGNRVSYFDAYYNVAAAYYQNKRYAEAILLYKKAVGISPGSAQGYFSLGTVYFAIKQDKEAIVYFKKAIALDPMLSAAYSFMALAYASQHNYALAIQYCDKAISLGYQVNPQFLEFLKPYRK